VIPPGYAAPAEGRFRVRAPALFLLPGTEAAKPDMLVASGPRTAHGIARHHFPTKSVLRAGRLWLTLPAQTRLIAVSAAISS
jgi:hypothetical protein